MKKFLFAIGLFVMVNSFLSGASESHIYVLVHGAWHGNWTYYKLQYELEKAGHTVVNINLPGHGLDTTAPGSVTLADYQNAIVQVLDTLPEPAVLVAHSMGGIAISMAAEARPNKIDKLVYLAAFMPKNGESMLDLALADSLSMIGPSLIFDFEHNTVDLVRDNISAIFYDISTAEYVLLSKMLLTPEPLLPLMTKLTLTPGNYGSVRRFYITTSYDRAITPAFQEKMYTEQPCEKVYTLNTEHSPFFSAPDNLKNILDKIGDDHNPLKSSVPKGSDLANSSEDDVKVYQKQENTFSLESKQVISKCDIKIYSLNGSLLDEKLMVPESKKFEFTVDNSGERVLLVVFNADGKLHTKKLLVH
jgi:pimeloyl-ACP methyl ester carboxylesterase